MNEVKFINCEQYVLARMFKLEQENEALKAKISDCEAVIASKDELMTLLKKYFRIDIACNNIDRFINFDSVWEKYDGADYDQLVALLGLEVPVIENTTEEET